MKSNAPLFGDPGAPSIGWIKNDPELYNTFEDGSKFLVALRVNNSKLNLTHWEFDIVVTVCDGDSMELKYSTDEVYDAWTWDDFEYFCLLDGELPWDDKYA